MNDKPPDFSLPPSMGDVLQTVAVHTSLLPEKKRRPVFLIILVIAQILFLYWLPAGSLAALWMGLSAQRELVSLLVLFALITVSLIWSAGQRLDVHLFTMFNGRKYPAWLDRIMWLLTQLGNMFAAIIAAITLYILNYRRLSYEIVCGAILLWVLVEIIKVLADRDRPFRTLENTRVIGWKEIGDSFPSGHTSQIFFLATLFIHRFQLGIGFSAAIYTLASLVGFTRIYVGAHYPRDVFAGVVLGSVWGLLALLVNPY